MKILQRNLNRSVCIVWEMKRNVSIVCVCSRWNILISGKIIKEIPSSVSRGTSCIISSKNKKKGCRRKNRREVARRNIGTRKIVRIVARLFSDVISTESFNYCRDASIQNTKKKSATSSLLRLVGLLIMKVTMATLQNGMTTLSNRRDCICDIFVQLGEGLSGRVGNKICQLISWRGGTCLPSHTQKMYFFWTCVYLYLPVLYCLYCVFVLFRLCILILICFVCTSVRTTATEWQLSCSQ